LTDQDLDILYERLKHHVPTEDAGSPSISSEDMERMVADSNSQIQQVREEMKKSVIDLKEQVEVVSASVKKQNGVILGLSKTLENTTIDLKNNVNEKIGTLTAQISELRELVQSLLPPSALQAFAQLGGQAIK
jgi:vacuolar-type H+-ATPase subunit I/STV1